MANGDPYPYYIGTPTYPPCYTSPVAAPHMVRHVLSIEEQMGTDPINKLAAAIEKLADALKDEGMGG